MKIRNQEPPVDRGLLSFGQRMDKTADPRFAYPGITSPSPPSIGARAHTFGAEALVFADACGLFGPCGVGDHVAEVGDVPLAGDDVAIAARHDHARTVTAWPRITALSGYGVGVWGRVVRR